MKGDELDPSRREEPPIRLHQRIAIIGHWFSAKPDGLLGSGKRLAGTGWSVEDEVHGGNRHGPLSVFDGVGRRFCLRWLGGGVVEGDPEESL